MDSPLEEGVEEGLAPEKVVLTRGVAAYLQQYRLGSKMRCNHKQRVFRFGTAADGAWNTELLYEANGLELR